MTVYCHLCPVCNYCTVGKPEMSADHIRRPSDAHLIEVMFDVTVKCPLRRIIGETEKKYIIGEKRSETTQE